MDETQAFRPVAVDADPENGKAMGSGDLTINAFRIDDDDDDDDADTNVERFDDEIFRDNTTNHHTYFLGLCCDFRKAVLWVNGISMAANIVFWILIAVQLNQFEQELDFDEDDYIDDEYIDEYIANTMRQMETPVIVVETIAIALSAIGFYGALKFKIWAVFVAALMHGISFVFAVIQFSAFDAVATAFSLYPHICLLILMRKGIVRESNYHAISSCCGNPNPSTDPKDHHMYFFGVCCDFRRAVLVLNVISIVLRLLLMVGFAVLGKFVTDNLEDIEEDIQDDEVRNSVDVAVKSGYMIVLEIFVEVIEFCAIVFGAIGLYGALKFKSWAIITAVSFYAFALICTIFIVDVVDAIFYIICLYAHFSMLRLMRAGIMTDENYHNVARCCGCCRSRSM